MTAAMVTTKTTTTIVIVVILSFLGSASWGVTLFSEIKFWKPNQYKQVKSEILFLEKIKHKVQMNKTVSFTEDEQKQFLLYKKLFGSINHHQ